MVVINGKVFIHLFKCAGLTLYNILTRLKGWRVEYSEYHKNLSDLPSQFNDYDKYALVRNPLTWYVSFYCYFIKGATLASPLVKIDLTEYTGLTLDEFIAKAVDYKGTGNSLYKTIVDTMGIKDCSMYQMETQAEEMYNIFEVYNYKRTNIQESKDIPSKESLELILAADEELFDLFGYEKVIT